MHFSTTFLCRKDFLDFIVAEFSGEIDDNYSLALSLNGFRYEIYEKVGLELMPRFISVFISNDCVESVMDTYVNISEVYSDDIRTRFGANRSATGFANLMEMVITHCEKLKLQ
jgi:hypothetical protein